VVCDPENGWMTGSLNTATNVDTIGHFPGRHQAVPAAPAPPEQSR
jgi:hypothetical protein